MSNEIGQYKSLLTEIKIADLLFLPPAMARMIFEITKLPVWKLESSTIRQLPVAKSINKIGKLPVSQLEAPFILPPIVAKLVNEIVQRPVAQLKGGRKSRLSIVTAVWHIILNVNFYWFMRQFYKEYSNNQKLLLLAREIGWTQNLDKLSFVRELLDNTKGL